MVYRVINIISAGTAGTAGTDIRLTRKIIICVFNYCQPVSVPAVPAANFSFLKKPIDKRYLVTSFDAGNSHLGLWVVPVIFYPLRFVFSYMFITIYYIYQQSPTEATMNQAMQYSIEIDGQKFTVPDPVIISQEAMEQNAGREKISGLIVVYDPKKQAGAILVPGEVENPHWIVHVPITQEYFADKVNGIISKTYKAAKKFN